MDSTESRKGGNMKTKLSPRMLELLSIMKASKTLSVVSAHKYPTADALVRRGLATVHPRTCGVTVWTLTDLGVAS